MSKPTLVFIPGSWHKPICYDKVIAQLETQHAIRCARVALPSTMDNPQATFKNDIDAARAVIVAETSQGRDVIVVAHSYGGMVGNSAIKGLTRPKTTASSSAVPAINDARGDGHVIALVLIASGFSLTGVAFMDPLMGRPPPAWRIDKDSGYAVLVAPPQDLFYHDVPPSEVDYWVNQLTTQSLKVLFEGGEYVYAGWQDVPVWYIGTAEDKALPVVVQRVQVGMARGMGGVVHHFELQSSHSPFLSMPGHVVDVLLDVVRSTSGEAGQALGSAESAEMEVDVNVARDNDKRVEVPAVRLLAVGTWFRFGIPLLIGRMLGWSVTGFISLRALWRR